jgi:hypothetical protein
MKSFNDKDTKIFRGLIEIFKDKASRTQLKKHIYMVMSKDKLNKQSKIRQICTIS